MVTYSNNFLVVLILSVAISSIAKQDEPGPFSYCETQSRNIEVFYRGDEEREKIFTAVSFPFEPVVSTDFHLTISQ